MPHARTFAITLITVTLCISTSRANDAAAADKAAAKPAKAVTKTVKVLKDIAYLGDDRKEKLDLYLPATNALPEKQQRTLRPAIVIVHGGGWHGGDKAARREQNIGNTLAAAGYVCASINYRLCQKNDLIAPRLREVWPGNLHDCKTAVRFLRKHAKKYAIDKKHIGAIGGSAGGHLVGMLAVTSDTNQLNPDGPYADYSCSIQAVVPMYGVHDLLVIADRKKESLNPDDKQLCKQASAVTWITANDPPTLILHGTKDAIVPVKQSRILHDRLQAAKVPSRLIVIEGAPHSFHLQPKQQDLRSDVIEFFDRHLKSAK